MMQESKIANNFTNKDFLEVYLSKQKDLSRRQREYKKILSTKLKSREETIIEASFQNAIKQLEREKDDLRAQIWVANGVTHNRENDRSLKSIKCHVECQEVLADDIRKLKVAITNLQREISRVHKQIYDLNRKTVPESQHQAYVAKAQKKLMILENQLEVSVKRECGFAAVNTQLREKIVFALNHRTRFNEFYTKLVQKLNSDKKYLIDLIEYALGTFDNCIDIYEKIDNITKGEAKERDLRKSDLEGIIRKIAADSDNVEFMDTKGKARVLADLQPKEYARREKFRQEHTKKIDLYNKILEKIQACTKTENVANVIEKFQQQESLYYSYFNYANELSYHMTLLTNSVNRLYSDIESLKNSNLQSVQEQNLTIERLERSLADKQNKNNGLQIIRESNDKRLEQLLQGIESLFQMCRCDASPLKTLLGNHENVDLVNIRRFLKILERRVFNITASVYILERKDESKAFGDYIVKQIEKVCDMPTDIDEIVLTQQCPECAEGEAFNADDGGDGGTIVHTVEQAKMKLQEKINQPEMQYRLHSISQCRLPRSKLLAAQMHS